MSQASKPVARAGRVAFELDRFELTDGQRCELEGRWFGVRGRRFMRPALTVVVDGGPTERFVLRSAEARSFEGAASIRLNIDRGASSEVVVNGFSLGSPGEPNAPYSATFTPTDYRTPTPGPTH